jgi:hypothetical protein
MRVGRVVGVVALAGLLALTPGLLDYARHELEAKSELDALTQRLPARTVVLDTAAEVGRTEGACQLLVASVLGTELGVAQVADFAASAAPLRADATRVAWAEPGAFRHRAVRSPHPDGAPIPAVVEHQLSRWLALPAGVRRVVLYRTEPLDAGHDPRCLGSAS